MTSKKQPQVFLRGTGSGIPGVNDPDLKDGKAGCLVKLVDPLACMVKDFGLHNPKTGKKVDHDWAKRNMGLDTYSCGNVDLVRKCKAGRGAEIGGFETVIPDDAVNVTEHELCFKAFEEALAVSNLKPSDIDVILHASPTMNRIHFWEGMCEWKRQFPTLKDTVQLQQHPIGCPAFLMELKLARQLLCSPEINNVCIVLSNYMSGTKEDVEMAKLFCSDNDLKKWVNLVQFGDGAAAAIISTDTQNLPEMVYDVMHVDYKIDNEEWVSRVCAPPLGVEMKDPLRAYMKPVYELNVRGSLLIKGAWDHWCSVLKKRYRFTLSSTKHIALHAPNPRVLRLLTRYYCMEGKVSYLPNTIGNLGPAGCVANLHDLLEGTGGRREHAHTVLPGETIMGFALGAATGVADGVFLLKARQTKADKPSSVKNRGKPLKQVMDNRNDTNAISNKIMFGFIPVDEAIVKLMWAGLILSLLCTYMGPQLQSFTEKFGFGMMDRSMDVGIGVDEIPIVNSSA